MARRYTVCDGQLVLLLEEAAEGGFTVTSPVDPGLVTEAETVRGAFANARDALRELARARASLARKLAKPTRGAA